MGVNPLSRRPRYGTGEDRLVLPWVGVAYSYARGSVGGDFAGSAGIFALD